MVNFTHFLGFLHQNIRRVIMTLDLLSKNQKAGDCTIFVEMSVWLLFTCEINEIKSYQRTFFINKIFSVSYTESLTCINISALYFLATLKTLFFFVHFVSKFGLVIEIDRDPKSIHSREWNKINRYITYIKRIQNTDCSINYFHRIR